MAASRKGRKLVKQQIRQHHRSRRGIYLLAALIIVIIAAVGSYVYLTIPKADFTVDAPSTLNLSAGVPTNSTITVSGVNQFSGTISLTANVGGGATASISPSTLNGPGTATLTVNAPTAGNYTVTVIATGGGLSHTAESTGWVTPIYAKLVTTNGTIVVQLFPNSAPKTVANFVSLAKSGFYSNLVWHRISNSANVIQSGDPTTRNAGGDRSKWGQGGSSQTVPLEIDPNLHNTVGTIGMARTSDPNSATSQFYINTATNSGFDGSYAVFGQVVSGMNVVNILTSTPISSQYSEQPANPLAAMLISVTISNSPY